MLDRGPILVPLDGSELAEGALPYAVAFARAFNERIVLLTAWEGADSELAAALPSMVVDLQQKAETYFGEYLGGIKSRIGSEVRVETRVVGGAADEAISEAAEQLDARAMVIATHGRSGIGRWVYGSTAGRLLRESDVPVLAVGPNALRRGSDAVTFKHILLPLDGSPLSEKAVAPAVILARATGAKVTLARVVRWAVQSYPYSLPDAYIPQVDAELEQGADTYLQKQRAGLEGVQSDAFVVRGAVADGLIDVVEQQDVDLVVMTTHARAGIARAALGSTADRLLQGAAPVLLLRPKS